MLQEELEAMIEEQGDSRAPLCHRKLIGMIWSKGMRLHIHKCISEHGRKEKPRSGAILALCIA